ncbi:MAG: HAD-IIA family hydrolase [Propionibacteriaceae bacterium]|nr:HAD-IIA family hydrolase [Propionibacteriaceae bacterium]
MNAFIDDYDVAMFDLDGVLYLGPDAVEGAVEGVAELKRRGVRPTYVTNNAARSTQAVADHLATLGYPATEPDVISSAQAAAALVATEYPPGTTALVVGTENLVNLVSEAGLRPVESAEDDPAVVIQGYDPAMTWPRLEEAGFAIQRGARWIATNTDATRPTNRGIVPGLGTMVAAVQVTVAVTPTVVGKPHRPLMAEALRRTGARNPVFVGDRIDTDIMGAHAVGIDSFFVFTGAHGVLDVCRAPADGRPTAIGWNVGSLFEPRRTADVDAEGATCGSIRVRIVDTGAAIEGDITGRPAQLDAAWALAQLCWNGSVSSPEEAAARLDLLP